MATVREIHSSRLDVCLLGRFSVTVDGETISGLDGRRQQELLGFLIINRYRALTRGGAIRNPVAGVSW